MAITQWKLYRPTGHPAARSILLCDDDPDFLALLQSQLQRIFRKLNMHFTVTAFDRPSSVTSEALRSCSMAFLDIDFAGSDRNGLDLARQLRLQNQQSLLFFITNYIEYAPEGFEVQAFRYILKRDLEQVLERYLLQATEVLSEEQLLLRLTDPDRNTDLPLADITHLEVLDHSVSIHAGDAVYTMAATLSSFAQQLEHHGFLRIHKSFLVNMDHIRRFRSRECVLSSGITLPVSEKNYTRQKEQYLLWKGLK